MKIVIAGGNGYLGTLLVTYFKKEKENNIYVLTREHKVDESNVHYIKWDGVNMGYWKYFLEYTDVLINLTGKSVNCRYTQSNKEQIYLSRLESTSVLCEVVEKLKFPPKVFIQSSSATIYEYSEDKLMKESDGIIGEDFSMDVCKKWETVFNSFKLPKTRKIITRTSIVLGENGGAFPLMKKLTRFGFGGFQGDGNQRVSWITEEDYVRAIEFLIPQKSNVYNLCVPNPIKNKDFQYLLRKKLKVFFGLNVSKWLLSLGAVFIGTESELLLKSRNVYPENLLKLGFSFKTNSFEEFKI